MVVSNLKALALHLLSSFSVLSIIITAIVVVIVIRCWLDECCLCWNCHEILLKKSIYWRRKKSWTREGVGKERREEPAWKQNKRRGRDESQRRFWYRWQTVNKIERTTGGQIDFDLARHLITSLLETPWLSFSVQSCRRRRRPLRANWSVIRLVGVHYQQPFDTPPSCSEGGDNSVCRDGHGVWELPGLRCRVYTKHFTVNLWPGCSEDAVWCWCVQ